MDENKLIYWTQKYWFSAAVALGILIMGVIGTDFFFGSKKGRAEENLQRIKTLFASLENGEPLSQEALAAAEKILVNYPAIHPLYDGKMALAYLEHGETAKGSKYIEQMLNRVEPLISPACADFTKTTLLIEQGQIEHAFVQAKNLEQNLQSQSAFSYLRAYNLLRLCFLTKKLGKMDEMRSTWKTLVSLPAYPSLSSSLTEGSFQLETLFQ